MRAAALLLAAVLLGGCASPAGGPARAADEGYLLGEADAVKQLYWAKQALEAPREDRPAGRTEYFTWQSDGSSSDGRRLAPETVAVPVFIPEPLPAEPAGP